jgi:hypothetical protein
MVHRIPSASEMTEASERLHLGMVGLLRNLASGDSATAQKSREVLEEIGMVSVPFLIFAIDGMNNRKIAFQAIEILDKLGPQAWRQVSLPLYPKLLHNQDPEVCKKIIQSMARLPPYKPAHLVAEGQVSPEGRLTEPSLLSNSTLPHAEI